MTSSYTVKKGDTLSEIVKAKYNLTGSALQKKIKWVAAINDIPNPNRIKIGQVIKFEKSGSSGSTSSKKTNTNVAVVNHFGLQSDTDNTLFATWKWNKTRTVNGKASSTTENYKVQWQYYTANKIWFVGSYTDTTNKESIYSIPSNALRVRFRVRPISKTYKKKVSTGKNKTTEKTYSYWTANWSSWKVYNVKQDPPEKPSAPSDITINHQLKLTVKITNIDSEIDKVEFQVVRNNKTTKYTSGPKDVNGKGFVSYSVTVASGGTYQVRCRYIDKDGLKSEWSDLSGDYGTVPDTPASITKLRATGTSSVYIAWKKVNSATGYTIEYTENKSWFDSNTQGVSSTTLNKDNGNLPNHSEIQGLASGKEYFFRVRATNDSGSSGWTSIKSVIIGAKPSPPTTWSSTTTLTMGDTVTFYWVHNSRDASNITEARFELKCGGDVSTTPCYYNYTGDDDDDEEVNGVESYTIDTSDHSFFTDGAVIEWRVCTAGITGEFSDWSEYRQIICNETPTLSLEIDKKTDAGLEVIEDDIITEFPFYIFADASPDTQTPIGYHLSITANEKYTTLDDMGNETIVNEGDTVYSKHFETSNDPLSVEISAGNINLENGVSYRINCKVAMNSGLTAESSKIFTVAWDPINYEPNAVITYDPESYITHIRPYCEEVGYQYHKVTVRNGVYTKTDEILDYVYGESMNVTTTTGETVMYGVIDEDIEGYYCEVATPVELDDILLSVYRREFDGTFTELGVDLNNTDNISITDPHPALDYARYRIVATDVNTGRVSYHDVPGLPIGEKSVIIQWDEQYSTFDVTSDEEMEQPPWSGSLLRLPYNVDVSNSYNLDVNLVEYIGREHPVSYYGTQTGESMSISVDIDKTDEETLYAIRRLSIWKGDVYVREPSGAGYWANISVSYNQTHQELVIPISISVTRVEGGA